MHIITTFIGWIHKPDKNYMHIYVCDRPFLLYIFVKKKDIERNRENLLQKIN